MQLHLVPMQSHHAAALAELERLCFAAPRTEAQLLEETENPLGRFFVAEIDGEIAGYGGMKNIAGECYVENVAVFPDYRRKGIGRALTNRLIETARQEKCSLITLEVRPSNTAALEMYYALGFKEAGRRKNFYQDPTEDGLILTKYFRKRRRNDEDFGDRKLL